MKIRPPTADPTDRRAGVVVTAAWAAMSAAAVGFVLAFGVNFPFMDEWAAIPILAAPRPDPDWLWERHNEHLLPLPRLVYWAAFRLTGDLRAGMLLSAVAWSVLAKLLVDAARAVRGRSAYADVFFPVVLLNWSQYENLLMSYQVGFACSTVLAGLTLRELAAGGAATGRVLRVGLYAALLPMCGGHGLVLAGPGIAWLAAAGFARRREPRAAVLCGVLALGAVVSASQYVWAAPPPAPAWHPPLTGKTIAVGLLGFGSVGYGLAGWHLWPWLAVVPTAAVTVTVWCVAQRLRISDPLSPRFGGRGGGVRGVAPPIAVLQPPSPQPSPPQARGEGAATPHPNPPPQGGREQSRLDLFGLTVFVAGAFLLAAVIAWGRGRYGAFAVFFPRYGVLSALLPIGLFFLWLKFGGTRLRRWGPVALAGVVVALLPLNTRLGWADGRRLCEVQRTAEKDLRAGIPVELVAERTNFLVFNNPTAWAAAVEDYARHDLGRVKRVAHLPPVHTARVEAVEQPDGWFAARLSEVQSVVAVRVRVRYRNQDPHRPARFRSAWTVGNRERSRDDWLFRPPTNDFGDPTLVVWIDGPLAAVRFLPDADDPGGSEIAAVELLTLPPGSGDLRSTASTGRRPGR